MKVFGLLFLISSSLFAQKFTDDEIARWEQQAKTIAITRDTWGVPHIEGKTDADAVFGMLYAQCEDDFKRVERNYIIAIARLSEVEGEEKLFNDLRVRLFNDTIKAIRIFQESPPWLRNLCQAFADGTNYYLYKHPEVRPRLIKRFQPWMPLLFSEGSIGGDLESISLEDLRKFYGLQPGVRVLRQRGDGDDMEPEPRGSNGFAIAPSRTVNKNALLLINPHTTFYFRSELHVKSDEGLNAYGATTWGQFFIYQGFNEHCGWMHTSSGADVIDEYEEMVVGTPKALVYRYGKELRPVESEKVQLWYKKDSTLVKKEFTIYRTHHGPIIAQKGKKWISVRIMQEPLSALTQSFQRTKSTGYEDFRKVMMLRTNSSNNTVFADDKGNIAYWHGDFMPKRDPKFNWSQPVDGSNPLTDWQGLHSIDEIITLHNPASGWIQNCNSTPFTASGSSGPDPQAYPHYMAPDAENARGIHAVRVLENETSFTIDKLVAAAYDSYLPAFEKLLPSFLSAYETEAAANDTLKANYSEPVKLLKEWDLKTSTSSIPTTLAICWADELRHMIRSRIPGKTSQLGVIDLLMNASSQEKVEALSVMVTDFQREFGTWKIPWGDLNRYQRITSDIEPVFDDAKPSLAVPFTSSFWGSLAAFGARRYPNTDKLYGNVGNSFVAVVEFGKKVKAKSVVTGGASGHMESVHFTDQAQMYCQGKFKDVWFYKEDFMAHTERTYHPGE